MSTSRFVCFRDGLPVVLDKGTWRHALGGKTGAIPPSMKHKPVPCPRSEYERCFAPGTPLDESRAIAMKYKEQ